MLRATIYLLACSMLLGIVMGTNSMNSPRAGKRQAAPPAGPTVVNGYSLQCQVRGAEFSGACSSQNVGLGGGFRCDKIFCALLRNDGSYVAVETGKAMDGTHCRYGHWCQDGECVLAGDAPIPAPLGPGPRFKCQNPMKIWLHGTYRPPTVRPTVTSTSAPTLATTSASKSTASKPSRSISSETKTQNSSRNRVTESSTPGSPSKKKKLQ